MAKKSQVLRDRKREILIKKRAEQRAELRKRLKDRNVSIAEKIEIQEKFAKLGRNSCPTRLNRRCLHYILPFLLVRPEGHARAQDLNEGKTGMADRLDENTGGPGGVAGESPGNEIGARGERNDQRMKRA